MNYIRQVYIQFLWKSTVADMHHLFTHKLQEVKNRDLSDVRLPEFAYGFRFFDVLSAVVTVDGKRVMLRSRRMNVSPTHYYGGRVYTVAEFKRTYPNAPIISQIEDSGCKKMIINSVGEWCPLKRTDILLKVVS